MPKITSFILILLIIKYCSSHTYYTGGCPDVDPMKGFDMNQMLGQWYVIQKTSTTSSCIKYFFSKSINPNEYELEEISQNYLLDMTNLKHNFKYKGILTMDPYIIGKMNVNFPLTGSASYTVFITDYYKYAGIFTCQKLSFVNRQSAIILSREPYIELMYLNKMRSKLSSYGINPYELSFINQTECDETEKFDISIDQNTFTYDNIGSLLTRAGNRLVNGLQYAISAGKEYYNTMTDNVEKVMQSAK